jgi:hypothetical protein
MPPAASVRHNASSRSAYDADCAVRRERYGDLEPGDSSGRRAVVLPGKPEIQGPHEIRSPTTHPGVVGQERSAECLVHRDGDTVKHPPGGFE